MPKKTELANLEKRADLVRRLAMWQAEFEARTLKANEQARKYYNTHKQKADEAFAEVKKFKRQIATLDALVAAQEATE